MDQGTLNDIIGRHQQWMSGAREGRADLSCADLSRANLSGADLSGADLSRANLSCADLSDADLSGANLSGAHLSYAILSGANLSYANLSRAILSGAILSGAINIVDAGQDRRGHHFWAWLQNGKIQFSAGCKNFRSYSQAVAHYADNYTSDGDVKECLARIEFLNKEAQRRWGK